MNVRRTAIALAIAIPALARAQDPVAPLILRLPGGTRALGLGNTGVASRDDEVIFYNPAGLVNASGFSVSGERLSEHAETGALSAVTRFNGGGIGIGMRFANYEVPSGRFLATRETMIEPGTGTGTSLEAVVGVGQTIKGFRVGGALKYAEETARDVRIGHALGDVGISKDYFRTTFGLAVQNIGSNSDVLSQPINAPLRTTLGAAKGGIAGPLDYGVTAAVSLLRSDFVQPSGGVELSWSWLSGYSVTGRAGVRRSTLGEDPFTAGAGFSMDRLTIDYALETLSNSRLGHRIGLRVR